MATTSVKSPNVKRHQFCITNRKEKTATQGPWSHTLQSCTSPVLLVCSTANYLGSDKAKTAHPDVFLSSKIQFNGPVRSFVTWRLIHPDDATQGVVVLMETTDCCQFGCSHSTQKKTQQMGHSSHLFFFVCLFVFLLFFFACCLRAYFGDCPETFWSSTLRSRAAYLSHTSVVVNVVDSTRSTPPQKYGRAVSTVGQRPYKLSVVDKRRVDLKGSRLRSGSKMAFCFIPVFKMACKRTCVQSKYQTVLWWKLKLDEPDKKGDPAIKKQHLHLVQECRNSADDEQKPRLRKPGFVLGVRTFYRWKLFFFWKKNKQQKLFLTRNVRVLLWLAGRWAYWRFLKLHLSPKSCRIQQTNRQVKKKLGS